MCSILLTLKRQLGISWGKISRKRGSKGAKTWAREWKGVCVCVGMLAERQGGMLGLRRGSQAPVPFALSNGASFSEPRKGWLGQALHTVSWQPARERG